MRRLYKDDDSSKVRQDQVERLKAILSYLDAAAKPGDLNVPGFRLHRLKGQLRDFWSVSVSGNWRVVFCFEWGDVYDVDLVDYH